MAKRGKRSTIQTSFTSGEWSPSMYGRFDLPGYYSACRTLSNCVVHPHGGVSNRPGTQFIGDALGTKYIYDDSANRDYKSRLIPFMKSKSEVFILEFSYTSGPVFRVIKDGAYVIDSSSTVGIADITLASGYATIQTDSAHGFSDNDHVYITGVNGTTELNGFVWELYREKDADEFYILGPQSGVYTTYDGDSSGEVSKIYKESHYIQQADLFDFKYVQDNDAMYFVHPDYKPMKLTYTADDDWTFDYITFNPDPAKDVPINFTIENDTGDEPFYYWVITAVDADGVESDPSAPNLGSAGGGATWLPPLNGDPEYYRIYREMEATDLTAWVDNDGSERGTGRYGLVADVRGNRIYWKGSSDSPDMTKQPPDYVNRSTLETAVDVSAVTYTGSTVTITTSWAHGYSTGDYVWLSGLRDDEYYNSNKPGNPLEVSERRFKITVVDSTNFTLDDEDAQGGLGSGVIYSTFTIDGVSIDDTASPVPQVQKFDHKFDETDEYPSAVGIFQQRLVFGGSNDKPQTVWGSRTGAYDNFSSRIPIQDDDSYVFPLDSRIINSVEWIASTTHLLVGTEGDEFRLIPGPSSAAITPTSVQSVAQSSWGSASLQPLVVGDSVIYLQYGGHIVRDMEYSLEKDGYRGNEITFFASHLTEDYTITDWCYQRNPFSIIWAIRSDGNVIGMTYLKEYGILAWHYHDFGGDVESICCVPDGSGNDDVYMVVRRLLSGQGGSNARYGQSVYARFVEKLSVRMEDRSFQNSFFVDCGLEYNADGYNISAITEEGGGSNDLRITVTSHPFSNDDIVTISGVSGATELNGNQYTIVKIDANTIEIKDDGVTVQFDDVTTYISGGAVYETNAAASSVLVLRHLPYETVSTVEGGNPETGVTASMAGKITLANTCTKIIAGLPFVSDVETMDFSFAQAGGVALDKNRRVVDVSLILKDSYDFEIGPSSDRLRATNFIGTSTSPYTGEEQVNLYSGDGRSAIVYIRQTQPMPFTIAAMIPHVEIGDE